MFDRLPTLAETDCVEPLYSLVEIDRLVASFAYVWILILLSGYCWLTCLDTPCLGLDIFMKERTILADIPSLLSCILRAIEILRRDEQACVSSPAFLEAEKVDESIEKK